MTEASQSSQPVVGRLEATVRRLVLVNGERVAPDECIDFPVFSLVFFPKSAVRRTTLA